jgi:hypothetical protein
LYKYFVDFIDFACLS